MAHDITKVVKSFEESDLLIKGVSEKISLKQKSKGTDLLACYKASFVLIY